LKYFEVRNFRRIFYKCFYEILVNRNFRNVSRFKTFEKIFYIVLTNVCETNTLEYFKIPNIRQRKIVLTFQQKYLTAISIKLQLQQIE